MAVDVYEPCRIGDTPGGSGTVVELNRIVAAIVPVQLQVGDTDYHALLRKCQLRVSDFNAYWDNDPDVAAKPRTIADCDVAPPANRAPRYGRGHGGIPVGP